MKITYEKGEVVVRIPCTEETVKGAPVSKTGKSRMIATTGGFSAVDGAPPGVRVSLNLIGKP
jgi:hypothetical protein